jgi:BlaI family transcriptional regulator, penicillinase repressor
MAERAALSKGEMQVARAVWRLGQATVRQAHEAMPAARRMDFATVQTYLRRLEAKGYVRSSLAGHTRVYAAKVKPTKVIRETVEDLIDRLFGGEALPLMQHLIEDRGVSAAEIGELRRLLDRLEEERDDAGK